MNKSKDILSNESFSGIVYYMGIPSFMVNNCPCWVIRDNKGFILTYGELKPFVVGDVGEFDVWDEGQFIDFGDDFVKAYTTWAVENFILK